MPTTKSESAYNALFCGTASPFVKKVVVQLLMIASKLLWQKRKKAMRIKTLSLNKDKLLATGNPCACFGGGNFISK